MFERMCGGCCQYDDVGFSLGRPGSALTSLVTCSLLVGNIVS